MKRSFDSQRICKPQAENICIKEVGAGFVAKLVEHLPSMQEVLDLIAGVIFTMHVSNPRTQKLEAKRYEDHIYLQLHNKFQNSQDQMMSCVNWDKNRYH